MANNQSPIPGFKFLIIGRAGSGKTWSTRTLFDIPELQPVHVFLEPSMATIASFERAKWAYINPMGSNVTWDTLLTLAKKINTLGNDDLQKPMGGKADFTQWIELINLFNNFVDVRSGEKLGDIQKWNTDRVLILDGLTGLTQMSRGLQSGLKPLLTQPDYGVIMNNLYQILQYLVYQLRCHFVLISHIEKEKDEVSGGMSKTVSTIGRKLAPTIPPLFDDVVIAEKTGDQFTWTTVETDADTKNRNLPLSANIKQDFRILFEAWKKNGGIVIPTGAA